MTQEKPVCLSNENASHVECELGSPMKRGAQVGVSGFCPVGVPILHTRSSLTHLSPHPGQVTFYLILSTSGITIETTELEVELLLAT